MLKGFTRKFKPLEILTEEQVRAIHKAVLDVMRETGIMFDSDRALMDFDRIGCHVDYETKRVRFPEYLVEEAIRTSPSSYRIKARDPKHDVVYGGDTVYFQNFPGMQTVNLDSWEPRDATWQEYADLMTVLDALPNFHTVCCYPYYGFEGVPAVMRILEGFGVRILYSTKNQQVCNASDCCRFAIEMVKVTGGDICVATAGSAPLAWYEDQITAAYRAIEAACPLLIVQGTIMGATGPATIAGSAVTNLAAELSMLVLVQLLAPGMRVYIGSDTYPQNMKSGAPGFGRIGCDLNKAVENQMVRSYKIPPRDGPPGNVSSKKADFQTGYEKAIAALVSALTGSNLIVLHSGLYGEITAHPIQAILDDDIAGMVGRFIEGVAVNDETIALDLVHEIGPIPGNYLGTAHTREWWKKEQFVPKAADSLTYPEWMNAGKKDCIDYAKEVMEQILATHKVSMPLTSSQEDDIRRILREAREWYRKNGQISDDEWKIYEQKVLKSPDYPFA